MKANKAAIDFIGHVNRRNRISLANTCRIGRHFMAQHSPDRSFEVEKLAPGTIHDLDQDCSILIPPCQCDPSLIEAAHDEGLIVLEAEPEPFGGPGVGEPLARAVESLKQAGKLPSPRPKAS